MPRYRSDVERLERDVNGADLWVSQRGTGVPVVLHTGGAGLADYLEPVAAMLDDIASVTRFDPRGCGRSSRTPPFDVSTFIGDLDVLRARIGPENWIVGGHSFGADLALAYALENPSRTRALLYLSGTGLQDDRSWHTEYEAGRDAGKDPPPATAYPYEPEVNRAANASWRAYIKRPDLLRRVSELDIPVLAVVGAEDVRPSWPVEQLVNLLPNAQLEVIPGAGHCPWVSHACDLGEVVRTFVAAHAAR